MVAAPALESFSSASLAWIDNATNATGYAVERSSDGATFGQIAQLGSSATSYADSGLAAGSTYYYRVSAYDSAGWSAYSNIASTQTQVTAQVVVQAPAVPSSPSPTNGATTVNGNVTLSWGATAGAQGYDVYFGTSSAPGLRASNLSSTTQTVGSLNAGTIPLDGGREERIGTTASPL